MCKQFRTIFEQIQSENFILVLHKSTVTIIYLICHNVKNNFSVNQYLNFSIIFKYNLKILVNELS